MKGKIETSSTISLPIANKDSNTINVPFGNSKLETFIKESLISCYQYCKIGNNLVKTPTNNYSITLDSNCKVILIVDLNSIVQDPGCGEICKNWQPIV